jgi:DNA-binding transcriptional ArsR family regulator
LITMWLYSHMVMDRYADRLSGAFHALGDPTRRAILARLTAGEATVSQLMEPFELSQPTISKHLKVLENAGLIEGGRDAQRRPRRLAALAMKDIADWIEPFRQQWESRFDNLDAHLATKKKQET